MRSLQKIQSRPIPLKTERILVVKRSVLFTEPSWTGFKKIDFEKYEQLIKNHQTFIPRHEAETDFTYKQIIPYLIFKNEDRYFLMQRRKSASETRLANKYTLGIGGHLREEDMEGKSLFDWARREFHEEINYSGSLDITPLGILNDDSDDVGKVHTGFVFLLEGDSSDISIKSELKNGHLLTQEECEKHYSSMETWSQMAFSFLTNKVI